MWIDLLPLLVPAEATTERPLGEREDWCLICDEPRRFAVARVSRRLAWLNIPIGPSRSVGYRLLCGHCGGTFGLPVGGGKGQADDGADAGDELATAPYLMDDISWWKAAADRYGRGKLSSDDRHQIIEAVVQRLIHAELAKPGLIQWPWLVTASVLCIVLFMCLAMFGLRTLPSVTFIVGCMVMVVVSGAAAIWFDRRDQGRRWRRAFDPVFGRVLRDLGTYDAELAGARRRAMKAIPTRKQRDEAPSLSRMKRLLRTR